MKFSMLLSTFGLLLTPNSVGHSLDYEAALENFQKCITIVEKMFGENRAADLKNSFLITAPGFIKNLVVQGGPAIKKGIVNINSAEKLRKNVDEFNLNFERVGVL